MRVYYTLKKIKIIIHSLYIIESHSIYNIQISIFYFIANKKFNQEVQKVLKEMYNLMSQ